MRREKNGRLTNGCVYYHNLVFYWLSERNICSDNKNEISVRFNLNTGTWIADSLEITWRVLCDRFFAFNLNKIQQVSVVYGGWTSTEIHYDLLRQKAKNLSFKTRYIIISNESAINPKLGLPVVWSYAWTDGLKTRWLKWLRIKLPT